MTKLILLGITLVSSITTAFYLNAIKTIPKKTMERTVIHEVTPAPQIPFCSYI